MNAMKNRFLEVTFRGGRPFAAYLHVRRPEDTRVARSQPLAHGLVADLSANGRPLGIEFTAPSALTLEQLNQVLAELGVPEADALEFAPLHAA